MVNTVEILKLKTFLTVFLKLVTFSFFRNVAATRRLSTLHVLLHVAFLWVSGSSSRGFLQVLAENGQVSSAARDVT